MIPAVAPLVALRGALGAISPRTIATIAIAAAAAATGWVVRGKFAAAAAARVEAAHQRHAAETARQHTAALQAVRQREQTLINRTAEIANEAITLHASLQADAAAAATAGQRLRHTVAAALARCNAPGSPGAQHPPHAGSSPPATLRSGMHDGDGLLRVFTELQGAAGAYADLADRSRAAGHTCQAYADEVIRACSPQPNQQPRTAPSNSAGTGTSTSTVPATP